MAGHLLAAGHTVHIYTRTREKAEDLVEKGAIWEGSPADIARKCGVIFTVVGFPRDVEEVYFGPDGLISNSEAGTRFIDMTTSRPDLAVRIYQEAKRRGCTALDAPVSGGDIGAREARLSIMVGGDEDAYNTVLPLLKLLGTNIVLQGGPGSGQHCKMCNQITIAGTMLGVSEAMAYAIRAGLSPERVLESISSGAAGSWTLSNLAPRMLAGNFEPGFFVKHFIKDMQIAAEAASSMGLDTPGLELAKLLYEKLAESGGEDLGTQALFKLYQEDL
jgi:3-hydroxyisobutyrate dehydrogenase